MFTRQDHGCGAAPGLTRTHNRASLLTNIDHGSGPPLRSELANIRSHFSRTKSASQGASPMNAYLVYQAQQVERAKTIAEIRRIEERVSRMARAKPGVRRRTARQPGAAPQAWPGPCC